MCIDFCPQGGGAVYTSGAFVRRTEWECETGSALLALIVTTTSGAYAYDDGLYFSFGWLRE